MTDREAQFRQWLQDHRGILVRISRAYAAGPADEEDLFQDVLLALWRSMPGFRGEAKVSTWIYQVALHVALSRRRADRRRPVSSRLEAAVEPRHDGVAAAEQRIAWMTVLGALRRLPALDRAVLLLALEGATQQETADVLGTTASHAGVKLHRARRKLAELLGT
jgi:RNA polymerase sigma-70 factor (ECF subfamily)